MSQEFVQIVDVIQFLYADQNLAKFRPPIGGYVGKRRYGAKGPNASKQSVQSDIMYSIQSIRLDDKFSHMSNKESIESILKKASGFHFMTSKPKNDNEIQKLNTVICSIKENPDMSDSDRDNLKLLEEKHTELVGQLEVIDYNAIAIKALKILSKNDAQSHELFTMIRKKVCPNEKLPFVFPVHKFKTDLSDGAYVPPHMRSKQYQPTDISQRADIIQEKEHVDFTFSNDDFPALGTRVEITKGVWGK